MMPGVGPLCVMHFIGSLALGGAEKLAHDMVASLPPQHYRAVVVCVGQDGPLGGMFRERGVPLYQRPNDPREIWGIVSWVRGIMKREGVAVIHAHQYNPLQYAVLAALTAPQVNVVYTEHGRTYPEQWRWKRYLSNPLLSLRINHMVSISHSTKEAMGRYDNFPASRISVIHNGVELRPLPAGFDPLRKRQELGLDPASRLIGTASRLDAVKNIPMMLRAFRRIAAARRDRVVLLVAGAGDEEAGLKELARQLGIAERVRFLGLRWDLPELFALLEVFLLVSFTEGVSVTLLEAMGSGVPVVVTRAGGNAEVVVGGVSGRLVAVDDDEALSSRVLELLEDREEAARLGDGARERVRRDFSFGAMMDGYLHLYRQGPGVGRCFSFLAGRHARGDGASDGNERARR